MVPPHYALLVDLPGLRHQLHRLAEVAFAEVETSKAVAAFLRKRGVTVLATDIAGHGILARVGPEGPGPLFRADMDALPLREKTGVPHAAMNGCHHACGHDGHMAMLAGALATLRDSPATVYGFFQPAEETGAGAEVSLGDTRLANFTSVFAIHNMPGLSAGSVHVREGDAAMASCGLEISFQGASRHASHPEANQGAAVALSELCLELVRLATAPAQCTIVGMDVGGPDYGTSPGRGQGFATLRAPSTNDLNDLLQRAQQRALDSARRMGLTCSFKRVDSFPACHNARDAVNAVRRAAHRAGLPCDEAERASWSEDFGHFLSRWPGALILLGAGIRQPGLHSPVYDFPDDVLAQGVAFWVALAKEATA